MTDYPFTKSPVYQSALIREIVAAGIDKPAQMMVDGTALTISFDEELTSGEEISLNTVVTAHPDLDEYKQMKTAQIDHRTGELIAEGYMYPDEEGNHFSASMPAQKNLIFVQQAMIMKMLADVMEQVKSNRAAIVAAGQTPDKDNDMRDDNPYVWAYMRGLTFPHEMSTHEDDLQIEYELPAEIDVLKMCATCATKVLTAYNGGRDLKKQVRDATNHAGVDAVVDTR